VFRSLKSGNGVPLGNGGVPVHQIRDGMVTRHENDTQDAAGHSELSSAQTYQPFYLERYHSDTLCGRTPINKHGLEFLEWLSNQSCEKKGQSLKLISIRLSWGISFPKLSSVTKATNLDALKEVYQNPRNSPQFYNDMPYVFVLHLRSTL
jgi:hypothetical protein